MSVQEEYEFISEREFLVFVESDLGRDSRVRELQVLYVLVGLFYFNSGEVFF